MGARRMTLADFYALNGFGQVSGRGAVAYPDFPTHNAKLQTLYRFVDPSGPVVAPILGQLDLARAYQEQGLHLQSAQALAAADTLLDDALRAHGPGGGRFVAVLLVILAVLAVAWWMNRRGGAPRLPGSRRRNLPPPKPKRRRRRARKANDDDDDNDELAEDDDAEDQPGDSPEDEDDGDEDDAS